MVAGSVAMAASFVILAGISVDDAVVICVAVLFVQGIGQGLAYNVSTTAAMSEIPEQKAGVASGMIAVLRLLGMVIGLALSVTVQTTVGSGATGRSAPGVIDGMLSVAIFSFVVAAASAAFALLYRDRSGVASPP
jgi:MFS family permease